MNALEMNLCYDRIELINREQRRQIEIHKWIQSEKSGYDLKDEATLEWIEKYAPLFRKWAESLPYTCMHCGACKGPNAVGMCPTPFDQKRIDFIEKDKN